MNAHVVRNGFGDGSGNGPVNGFGQALRGARRRAGLTQDQVAGLSTVSVRAIRDLEQGRVTHPRKDTVRLLAAAMRLSDAQRAALEMAADCAWSSTALAEAYGAELVLPPVPLRPLVGRETELRALGGLLAAERERLVSVVGLPGVGKTRLAQEAAAALHTSERIPVLWAAADPAGRVVAGARHSLQQTLVDWANSALRNGGGHEDLADVIRDRPTLLVLDGYEAASAGTLALNALLHACPRLKVLITSRRPHQLPGGRFLPLAPLPVPRADPAARGEDAGAPAADLPAVELLLSHVGHSRPDLAPSGSLTLTLARLSRALDGLPGALEAVVAWLPLYTPEYLLAAVRSAPLAMIDGPVPAGGGAGLAAALAETVEALPAPLAAAVSAVAALPSPWTVASAARALGVPAVEAARTVHALLLRGLVRQLPYRPDPDAGEQLPRFAVLDLVRRLAPAPGEPGPHALAEPAVALTAA